MDAANTTEPASMPTTRFGRFFYAQEIPYGLAVIRVLMPLVLLAVVLPRWRHARELFSADGAAAPMAVNYGYFDFLPELPGAAVVGLTTALVFFLFASSIGWYTRFSLIVSTVLYTYLNMLDSLSSMTKYSVIATHAMFLLSLSNCGAIWSVDSWRKGDWKRNPWPGGTSVESLAFPAWPRRLMQLFIGIVYFGAAVTKMHTPAFFSGDQLRFWMMSNVNNDNPLGEYMTLFPTLIALSAYIAIVWEVLFVFLAWRGWWRPLMLTLGMCFHVMTTFTLGLYIFPLVCITIYFSFLTADDVRAAARFWRRCRRKLGWTWKFGTFIEAQVGRLTFPRLQRCPAPVVFGVVTMVIVLLGIEAEYWLDPYGERRAEGPYQLTEVDHAYVQRLYLPASRIRESDKFLSFDVGTRLVNGNLANRRTVFSHGECLLAQCAFNPPHEDMWVECNLHDAADSPVDRVGQVVTRSMMRCNFTYTLFEDLEPGKYSLVVKSGGREIARRPILLQRRSTSTRSMSPVAN